MAGNALKKISREAPSPEELAKIREGTKQFDDRSAAIIVASLTEHALETAIRNSLPPMADGDWAGLVERDDGPLLAFGPKIKIAYALQIIDQLARDDLRVLKNIRNAFAHAKKDIRFESANVAAACAALKIVDLLEPIYTPHQADLNDRRANPRFRYLLTAHVLEQMLHQVQRIESGSAP